ncbi:histidine phosphatase superfamily [Lasiosphaeria ovina]|uniref:Histidine phosphatase superfamily n=1 Tax=Lasiosphaeria ovina TaxID=92902 RepID=A0AAE0TYB7_9PEZI|nr:histidine phosphatase superfamily [Lasiosphaeria ovina]
MPPTLVLIRHAEGLHNVDNNIPDPELSELGRRQCGDLRENIMARIPKELDVGLIIVSPMRRTIETAMLVFHDLISKGVPIQAHAGWQENSAQPCDTGSPIPQLVAEFPLVDFSHVDPVFPDKTSPAGAKYRHTRQAIVARGQAALHDLYSRPEKVIVVVSHSGFLRVGVAGFWFFKADYRIFDFEEREDASSPYRLLRWDSTAAGGMGLSKEHPVPLGDGLPDDEGTEHEGSA